MKLVFILLIAAAILGAFFYLEKTRTDALGAIAKDMGFSFSGGQQTMPGELDKAGFYLSAQGGREILNYMQGQDNDYVYRLFGYAYKAGVGMEGMRERPNSGDDGQIETRIQTVAWLTSNHHQLPDFDLTPALGPIRRAAKEANLTRITFDGRGDFDDKYILAARDTAAVRALFRPELIDYLIAHPGITFESRGNQWLVYHEGNRAKPEDVPALLAMAKDVSAMMTAVPMAPAQ